MIGEDELGEELPPRAGDAVGEERVYVDEPRCGDDAALMQLLPSLPIVNITSPSVTPCHGNTGTLSHASSTLARDRIPDDFLAFTCTPPAYCGPVVATHPACDEPAIHSAPWSFLPPAFGLPVSLLPLPPPPLLLQLPSGRPVREVRYA